MTSCARQRCSSPSITPMWCTFWASVWMSSPRQSVCSVLHAFSSVGVRLCVCRWAGVVRVFACVCVCVCVCVCQRCSSPSITPTLCTFWVSVWMSSPRQSVCSPLSPTFVRGHGQTPLKPIEDQSSLFTFVRAHGDDLKDLLKSKSISLRVWAPVSFPPLALSACAWVCQCMLEMLKSLDHPNVVPILGVSMDEQPEAKRMFTSFSLCYFRGLSPWRWCLRLVENQIYIYIYIYPVCAYV